MWPVRMWLGEGASLSAGTDYPIGSHSLLDTIWALATRETDSIGVQRVEYAADRLKAARLATGGTAQLPGESDRPGRIEPGRYADLVGYSKDPLTCAIDRVRNLHPMFTLVGGEPIYSATSLRRDLRNFGNANKRTYGQIDQLIRRRPRKAHAATTSTGEPSAPAGQ